MNGHVYWLRRTLRLTVCYRICMHMCACQILTYFLDLPGSFIKPKTREIYQWNLHLYVSWTSCHFTYKIQVRWLRTMSPTVPAELSELSPKDYEIFMICWIGLLVWKCRSHGCFLSEDVMQQMISLATFWQVTFLHGLCVLCYESMFDNFENIHSLKKVQPYHIASPSLQHTCNIPLSCPEFLKSFIHCSEHTRKDSNFKICSQQYHSTRHETMQRSSLSCVQHFPEEVSSVWLLTGEEMKLKQ